MRKGNNNRRKLAIGAVIAAGVTTGAMALNAENNANAARANRLREGLVMRVRLV